MTNTTSESDWNNMEIAPLMKHAENGDPEAQLELSLRFLDGVRGAEKSTEQHIFWLISSAQKKNKKAQYILGSWYEEGYGVPQDDLEALRLFTDSAKQGDADAISALSEIYFYGDTDKGIRQDPATGLALTALAAKASDTYYFQDIRATLFNKLAAEPPPLGTEILVQIVEAASPTCIPPSDPKERERWTLDITGKETVCPVI